MNYLEKLVSVLDPLMSDYPSVALFDFPRYDNVGDLAIWMGEVHFLRDVLKKRIVAVEHCRSEVLPELAADTVILLSGGGNLGDLWLDHETFRRRVVQCYPAHRVIVLPQSIFFSSAEALALSAAETRQHRDFHLCVRDVESLTAARELADPEKVYLCPDMALALESLPRPEKPSKSIYTLKRSDKEASDFGDFPPSVEYGDWVDAPVTSLGKLVASVDRLFTRYPNRLKAFGFLRIGLYNRLAREHVERGMRQLGHARVVVTDRLHAHLLCSLMGIPHVVLDNSYGKISRFRKEWQTGDGLCETASDWADAVTRAEALLESVGK